MRIIRDSLLGTDGIASILHNPTTQESQFHQLIRARAAVYAHLDSRWLGNGNTQASKGSRLEAPSLSFHDGRFSLLHTRRFPNTYADTARSSPQKERFSFHIRLHWQSGWANIRPVSLHLPTSDELCRSESLYNNFGLLTIRKHSDRRLLSNATATLLSKCRPVCRKHHFK